MEPGLGEPGSLSAVPPAVSLGFFSPGRCRVRIPPWDRRCLFITSNFTLALTSNPPGDSSSSPQGGWGRVSLTLEDSCSPSFGVRRTADEGQPAIVQTEAGSLTLCRHGPAHEPGCARCFPRRTLSRAGVPRGARRWTRILGRAQPLPKLDRVQSQPVSPGRKAPAG